MTIFTGSPKDLVLSQINAANNPTIPFTKENLFFGNPRLDADGLSIVPIAGVVATEYSDYSFVKYRRINLTTVFDSVPSIKAISAETVHEMLPAISNELGMSFTTDDILDADMAIINPGEQVNIEMVATKGSLAYTGKFVLRWMRIRQALAIATKNNSLAELNHLPPLPVDKRSLEMAMYAIDFTPYTADLRLWGSNWWFPVKVKEVARINGFPDWPTAQVNGVRDSATSAEPLANKDFDRVIIQKNVVVGNFKGDAYFHYNLT
jgi:hypothetical protein